MLTKDEWKRVAESLGIGFDKELLKEEVEPAEASGVRQRWRISLEFEVDTDGTYVPTCEDTLASLAELGQTGLPAS